MIDELLNEDYIVNLDETKFLFLKIIEQAIRDYTNLKRSVVPIEMEYFSSAEGFLFDDDYYILWGEFEISRPEILAHLDVDPDWFQRRLKDLVKR